MGRSETLHVHHSGAPIAAHGRAALRELGDAAIAHQTGCLVGLPGRPRTIGLGCLFRLHHLSPCCEHDRWGGVGGGAALAPPRGSMRSAGAFVCIISLLPMRRTGGGVSGEERRSLPPGVNGIGRRLRLPPLSSPRQEDPWGGGGGGAAP